MYDTLLRAADCVHFVDEKPYLFPQLPGHSKPDTRLMIARHRLEQLVSARLDTEVIAQQPLFQANVLDHTIFQLDRFRLVIEVAQGIDPKLKDEKFIFQVNEATHPGKALVDFTDFEGYAQAPGSGGTLFSTDGEPALP
jgi:hypothetical protein